MILDNEAVTVPTESADVFEITLPGLEGKGRLVPEDKSQN